MMPVKMSYRFLALVALALIVAGVFYRAVLPGLSSARNEPPGVEVALATYLLHYSVPDAQKQRSNPLGSDPAEITAGRDLFGQKCEICHAYDGSGKTDIGAKLYPQPPVLRSLDVTSMPDGEIFYHIRNGIRNTGMPAWDMPDRDIWRLVAYIRHLPSVATETQRQLAATDVPEGAQYTGSAACQKCHEDVYARWAKSRMANVVRDPRQHPDAIIPDLSKPDPLVTFKKEDIAFVYGSRWKQRYFRKDGDDLFPLSVTWDVVNKVFRPYLVANGTDWWTAHYPADNAKRPTGPLCDGCHSVNYNIETKTPTEWNVGCERCHGPGSAHVARPVASTILNPARLDYVRANDTCIQCHSQGQPATSPIAGKYYDWPVGFTPGQELHKFWKLEEHKLGETTFTHFADGTAHKNRMQGNDFVSSLMYARGVTCFSCHDAHGNDNPGIVRETGNALCLGCHGPNTQAGPRAPTIEQHTHHAAGSTGSTCIACHMPAIAQQVADVNVRSHTFRFVTPAKTETLKIPNACNVCHTDKTPEWAEAALTSWKDRSPWRMAQ
jgi:predicted CXXCH cytochrome family protein